MSKALEIEKQAHNAYFKEMMDKATAALDAGERRQKVLDDLHDKYLHAVYMTVAIYSDPASTTEQRATWKGKQTGALTALEDIAA